SICQGGASSSMPASAESKKSWSRPEISFAIDSSGFIEAYLWLYGAVCQSAGTRRVSASTLILLRRCAARAHCASRRSVCVDGTIVGIEDSWRTAFRAGGENLVRGVLTSGIYADEWLTSEASSTSTSCCRVSSAATV